jgi:hypothetical protein
MTSMRIRVAGLALLLTSAFAAGDGPSATRLTYGVEWRLIRAGTVHLSMQPAPGADLKWRSELRVESSGIVSALYKVQDRYAGNYDKAFCQVDSLLIAIEGRRHRETRISVQPDQKKAQYLEKDVKTGATVRAGDLAVPECVHDIPAALARLRQTKIEVGKSAELPVTDGKKFAMVKLEALEKQTIKVPAGSFNTIRHEVHIFNGVIYERAARLEVWLSDDARRLPVQIKIRAAFPIGTITLALEKEGV